MTNKNESTDPENPEPQIIVDEDWKEQVAKEKKQFEQGVPQEPQGTEQNAEQHSTEQHSTGEPTEASTSEISSSGEVPSTSEMPAPPPASFEMLVTMMLTQAFSMLGQIPDPITGKTQFNKPFAKHYIDTLDMLGEKTQGNLTDEEAKMHAEALHALRMAYVGTKAPSQ